MPLRPLEIFNLTPDSFSDGGENFDAQTISLKLKNSLQAGTKHFDFGCCSTAPQNSIISAGQEWRRWEQLFLPLLSNLPTTGLTLSFDTFYAENMAKLYEIVPKENEIIWNDVSGVLESECLELLKNTKLSYVYNFTFLQEKLQIGEHRSYCQEGIDIALEFKAAASSMVKKLSFMNDRLYLDPGIGFSKNAGQDRELLEYLLAAGLEEFSEKFLIGISRKSFFGQFIVEERRKKDLLLKEVLHASYLRRFKQQNPNQIVLWRLHDMDLYRALENL